MSRHTLERETRVPTNLEDTFAFFADAGNLETITPPWLHFRILTPLPIEMRAGATIRYRLRLHGCPLGWTTEITGWNPPHSFVDEQVRGPYGLWTHTHEFKETEEGTVVRDRVLYEVPLDRLLHSRFVKKDLDRIFDYRQEAIRKILAQ